MRNMAIVDLDATQKDDTTVQCHKCGKKQHLKFANGLKNGWSICCGYTMTIIKTTANIEEAVKSLPVKVEVTENGRKM